MSPSILDGSSDYIRRLESSMAQGQVASSMSFACKDHFRKHNLKNRRRFGSQKGAESIIEAAFQSF